jgi:hypothetical protein
MAVFESDIGGLSAHALSFLPLGGNPEVGGYCCFSGWKNGVRAGRSAVLFALFALSRQTVTGRTKMPVILLSGLCAESSQLRTSKSFVLS